MALRGEIPPEALATRGMTFKSLRSVDALPLRPTNRLLDRLDHDTAIAMAG